MPATDFDDFPAVVQPLIVRRGSWGAVAVGDVISPWSYMPDDASRLALLLATAPTLRVTRVLQPGIRGGKGKSFGCHVEGVDVFTGRAETAYRLHRFRYIMFPLCATSEYVVADVSDMGRLALLGDDGEQRDDLDAPADAAVINPAREALETGADVRAVVVACWGREVVVALRISAPEPSNSFDLCT
jgi:hypothetical protein